MASLYAKTFTSWKSPTDLALTATNSGDAGKARRAEHKGPHMQNQRPRVWLGGQRTCPVTPENPVYSSALTLVTAIDDIELKGDLDVHSGGRGSSQRDGQINSN